MGVWTELNFLKKLDINLKIPMIKFLGIVAPIIQTIERIEKIK